MKKNIPMRREERFGSLFDKRLGSDFFDKFLGEFHYPQVDIKDKGDHYQIEMDAPGFDKENLTVEYKDHYIQIRGEKNQSNESTEEEGHYIRKERTHNSFKREFYVGELESDQITGTFKNGILTLDVPKTDKDMEKNESGNTIKID